MYGLGILLEYFPTHQTPRRTPPGREKIRKFSAMGVGNGVDQIFGTSTDLVFAIWPLIEGVSAEGGWWKIIS